MEWAPSLSLAQESKQQGHDWCCCRRRAGVDAARPPLRVLTHSCRGRLARCHALAPTRNPGQITAAGDTCRNHQSPAAPCGPDWFVLTCSERGGPGWLEGMQAPPRIVAASGGIPTRFLGSPAAKGETAGRSGEDAHLVLRRRPHFGLV